MHVSDYLINVSEHDCLQENIFWRVTLFFHIIKCIFEGLIFTLISGKVGSACIFSFEHHHHNLEL